MTQFKVGDRVLVKDSTFYPIPETIAMIGTMCEVRHVFYKNDRAVVWNEGKTDWWTFNLADLEPVSTTPPTTIQHEGYNYTRGEPVVPEWVKDGAWVVEKETGDVMRLAVSKHAAKAININGHIKWYGSAPKNVPSVFRPFTNEDWKWGMWAEYKGEKVFVTSGKDGGGVFASKPTKPYFFIPFSEITPTTAP